MKKKILIGIAVFIALIVGAIFIYIMRTKDLSPKGKVELTNKDLKVTVTYGRPYKKGRLIFGKKEDGALVPYGQYWRLGANEATEITFSKDVQFGSLAVKAGSYRMYTVPGEKSWTVYLNTELGKWGAWDADHSMDLGKIEITPDQIQGPVEQFTIELKPSEEGIDMFFIWDSTAVKIPVK